MSAECLQPGDTCGPPSMPLPISGITICNPPADAGTDLEGGPDLDASAGEASLSDDGSPGDGSSPSDGGQVGDSDTPDAGGG